MIAWWLHRVSGVGILLFLILHILDIYLVGAAPDVYDTVLQIYASPPGRLMEVLLGAALLYHALNGLRITALDFFPDLVRYQRPIWYASWIVFLLVGIPVAIVILKPIVGA
jgi:succinate dehydrogenase / fumarate reductase, cytochrome b subunit